MPANPRQLAFLALREVYRQNAYTDIALDRILRENEVNSLDRGLVAELVYGCVRRMRSLDSLIDQLGTKKAQQQPPDLRLILHLGLYQLRYLDQIPPSAAVNTSVDLAKINQLHKLSGVVNGLLRQYLRLADKGSDPLQLPTDFVNQIGIQHSYPNWLVQMWETQLGREITEKLCIWFNQPATIDLRVNTLKTNIEQVKIAFSEAGVNFTTIPYAPQALRLASGSGAIQQLPGFQEGWWIVQDISAQLVTYLLNPQPGETIIDACAAPGGKTTHIAELMQDQGQIYACDRTENRLKKVISNAHRLQLKSITTLLGDSRHLANIPQLCDRVLLDAPCSGLGTLHKRPDIRWRQQPEQLAQLAQLQGELLAQTANFVKPGGILVYATCTLNYLENEAVIEHFLNQHPQWHIQFPHSSFPALELTSKSGWLKILPCHQQIDGFFMVKLAKET